MSKLETLALKAKKFREKFDNKISVLEKDFEEAEKVLDDLGDFTNISEPFTAANAPERIKKLPESLRDAWIKTFNSVFEDSKDEAKAFRIANAQIKKMREDNTELGEASPEGSFEAMRDMVSEALRNSKIFPKPKNDKCCPGGPFVRFMFLDKVIVGFDGKTFLVPFTNKDGKIVFDKPKEVVETFQVKETNKSKGSTLASELKENNITITKSAKVIDLDLAEFISLKEADFNEETGEVEVVLIEQGTNMNKRRHYPESTIREAAPLFSGLKMYINHPTKSEDRERPERNLKDWGSTVVESHFDNGKAMGKVAVHDNWLRERLKDPVARAHIGLSINAGGRVSYGKVQGQEMQVVEKIIMQRQNGPASVDWVTEAGARGRVSRLLKESNKEGKRMEILEATFEDLKKENPKLVEAIVKEVTKGIETSAENQKKEKDLKESKEKLAKFEKTEKIGKQTKLVESWMKDKKIPDAVKTRIVESLSENLFETEAKLKEAFEAKVKSELEYVNKFSAKGKIKTSSENTEEKPVMESLSKELDDRAGVKEEEKKEEDK